MTVIMQSIATSIDAFAVGISLSVLQVNIVVAVLLISLVTALFSLLGLKMGRAIGTKIGHKAELFGGIVLLGLGIKIFVEHTYF